MKAVLTCVLLASLCVCALAKDIPAKVYIDGKLQAYEPPAVVRGGVTYIPLRQAASSLGLTTEWMDKARAAKICGTSACTLVKASQGIIVKGHLLLPLREMAKVLNAELRWDSKAKAVHITRQAAPVQSRAPQQPQGPKPQH